APFLLDTGQRLKLPPPQEYKVEGGDTLYSVSRLFGVNTSEVASLNNLRTPYRLEAGQTLRLPSITRKTSPAVQQYAAVKPPAAVEKYPLAGQPPLMQEKTAQGALPAEAP